MDNSLCVLKGLVGMLDIGIYCSLLAKSLEIGKQVFTDMKSMHIVKKKVIMPASQDIGRVLTLIYLLYKIKRTTL